MSEETTTIEQGAEATAEEGSEAADEERQSRTETEEQQESTGPEDATAAEDESIPPLLRTGPDSPPVGTYVRNPERILDREMGLLELGLVLYYVQFVALPMSVVRKTPVWIRIPLSFLIGGYVFSAWNSVVDLGLAGEVIGSFALTIASISPGILLLSSILLVFGSLITYYLHQISAESDDPELRTDGNGETGLGLFTAWRRNAYRRLRSADSFSTVGALVGMTAGILLGGIFSPRMVLPGGIVGLVLGEEVGYRVRS